MQGGVVGVRGLLAPVGSRDEAWGASLIRKKKFFGTMGILAKYPKSIACLSKAPTGHDQLLSGVPESPGQASMVSSQESDRTRVSNWRKDEEVQTNPCWDPCVLEAGTKLGYHCLIDSGGHSVLFTRGWNWGHDRPRDSLTYRLLSQPTQRLLLLVSTPQRNGLGGIWYKKGVGCGTVIK